MSAPPAAVTSSTASRNDASAAHAVGAAAVPHVDWAAILAGAVLASAIAFILVAFGSGLGLSLVDPIGGEDTSTVLVAVCVGLWTLWVIVSSFMAGGYLAGRLRRKAHDATAHEVEVRDGSHGLVVWALGVLIGGWLTASGIAGITGAVADATGSAVSSVASGAASAAQGAADSVPNPMDYVTDTLLRSGEQGGDPVTDPAQVRDEVGRILTRTASDGELSDSDRQYLATLISRNTGASEEQAQQRIDGAVENVEQATADAKAAAETTRKTGILLSFLTAAALLISAAAAWWAATMGGRHRDEGTDFSHLFARK